MGPNGLEGGELEEVSRRDGEARKTSLRQAKKRGPLEGKKVHLSKDRRQKKGRRHKKSDRVGNLGKSLRRGKYQKGG